MGGDRYKGFDVLNAPVVQGIYSSFAEGNVNIFVIPRSQVQGVKISVAQHINVYMCTCKWSTCIPRGKFEAVPAYGMSQRWLRTRAFLNMPVNDAPKIENFLSQL